MTRIEFGIVVIGYTTCALLYTYLVVSYIWPYALTGS
jgi:hypothetical protein